MFQASNPNGSCAITQPTWTSAAVTYATPRRRKSRHHVIAPAYYVIIVGMRRLLGLAVVVACGGSGDDLKAHTSFVTSAQGSNPSPLDPLANQTIDFDVVWPSINSNNGDGSDPAG